MAKWIGSMPNGDSIYDMGGGVFSYGSDASGWQQSQGYPPGATPPKGAGPPAPQNPSYTGTTPQAGHTSTDYAGSYDEWFERTVASMADNYLMGQGQTSGFQDPSLGAPNEADFGSVKDGSTGTASDQTVRFFENYVRMYGATDPWIQEHFGPPPERRASYQTDPNSDAGLQSADNDWQGKQNELDRAADAAALAQERELTLKGYETDIQLAGMQQQTAREGFQNQWNIATMEDATRRFVAEGDWGMQKFVAELQEKGQMDRLQLELGFRREELGQRALEAKNQHHEAMVALTLEVAKYDAELSAQPRNWLKYAAWLKNRGEVVDGLNLATAANMVPENAIDPGEVADTVNSPAGAFGLAQEVETGQYNVSGIDLNSTDYSGMANQLMGINSMNPEGAPTPAELQATSSTLQTTPQAQGQQVAANTPTSVSQSSAAFAAPLNAAQEKMQGNVGFRAYGGPTQNNLGMTIQPSGQKEIYGRFKRLLPSQQEMRMGEVESIGRYAPDFLQEMERSKPKGRATGATAYG